MFKKLLLVDDESAIRKIAELSLAKVGRFSVTVATTGREALACVVRDRPDVIVMDVMMPDMDGPTTMATLRSDAATRDIPIIFLTGSVGDMERLEYLQLGAAGVITKPFDPGGLPAEVLRILDLPR